MLFSFRALYAIFSKTFLNNSVVVFTATRWWGWYYKWHRWSWFVRWYQSSVKFSGSWTEVRSHQTCMCCIEKQTKQEKKLFLRKTSWRFLESLQRSSENFLIFFRELYDSLCTLKNIMNLGQCEVFIHESFRVLNKFLFCQVFSYSKTCGLHVLML